MDSTVHLALNYNQNLQPGQLEGSGGMVFLCRMHIQQSFWRIHSDFYPAHTPGLQALNSSFPTPLFRKKTIYFMNVWGGGEEGTERSHTCSSTIASHQPLGLEEFQHLTEVSPTKSNLPVMEQCTTGTAESP